MPPHSGTEAGEVKIWPPWQIIRSAPSGDLRTLPAKLPLGRSTYIPPSATNQALHGWKAKTNLRQSCDPLNMDCPDCRRLRFVTSVIVFTCCTWTWATYNYVLRLSSGSWNQKGNMKLCIMPGHIYKCSSNFGATFACLAEGC